MLPRPFPARYEREGLGRPRSPPKPHVPAYPGPRDVSYPASPGIGVVIKKDEIRPPAHPHGIAGGNQDAYRGLKTLRPRGNWPHRGICPVKGANSVAELSSAGKDLFGHLTIGWKCGHFACQREIGLLPAGGQEFG